MDWAVPDEVEPIPSAELALARATLSTLPAEKQRARALLLCLAEEEWVRLRRCNGYRSRIRLLKRNEPRDLPDQRFVNEVEIPPPDERVLASLSGRSIARPLFQRLSSDAQSRYWVEVQKYVDEGWWVKYPPRSALHPVCHPSMCS